MLHTCCALLRTSIFARSASWFSADQLTNCRRRRLRAPASTASCCAGTLVGRRWLSTSSCSSVQVGRCGRQARLFISCWEIQEE